MQRNLKSLVADWLEERTGLVSALARWVDIAVPGGPKWRHVFGWTLLALFGIQLVTGLAMMAVYAPGSLTAWSSTWYLQDVVPFGALIRGMHHFASHGMVALLGVHMVGVVIARAYDRPREVTWWLGLGLAGMVLLFCISGFPLAWDQRGYWVSRIETGIAGTLPVIGPFVQHLAQGGSAYGSLTVTRFYTLHVALLPILTVALIAAHVAMVRRHGLSGVAKSGDTDTPAKWWPDQAARDAFACVVTGVVVFALAKKFGAHLDAPADPASHYPAVPEWFFMPLSQLLKHLKGPLQLIGTVGVPGALTTYLVLLPFLDRPGSSVGRRAALLLPLGLTAVGAVFLAWELKRDNSARPFRHAVWEAEQHAHRARELARQGIPPEGPLEMVRNDPRVRPRELFVQHCGTCHAARGLSEQHKGPRLDGFGGRQWATAFLVWPDHPELMGTTEIHDMPSQLRRLHDDGVRAVSEWLYSRGIEQGEAPADEALVALGGEIYHRRCTTCHLGEGDTSSTEASERDAPNLDAWGSRDYLRAQIVDPGSRDNYGARNHMTRFRGKLEERDIERIIDFMRDLRTREAPATQQEPPEAPEADTPAAAPSAAPAP